MSTETDSQESVYKYYQKNWFEWKNLPLHGGTVNTKEKLDEVEDFQFGKDDVLIWTYPKSGTHFSAEVVMDSMRAVGKLPEHRWYPLELGSPNHELRDSTPKVVFSHLPWRLLPKQAKEGKIKVVCVIHNTKDVCCSFYNFLLKLNLLEPGTDIDQFIEIYTTGKIHYGDYFDWIKEWHPHKDQPYILTLHFEDMKTDLKSSVLKITEHIDVSLTDEQVEKITSDNTFSNRINIPTDQFQKILLNKGESGGWKKQLSEEQISKLDDWISKSMEGLGFNIDLRL